MISLGKLQDNLSSLCSTIQTLIKDNNMLSLSPSPQTPINCKDTDRDLISWDFMVRLCRCEVPQTDPSTRPYIPPCVKRVANMYNCNRNTRFLQVCHVKHEGLDMFVCRTDDFIYKYYPSGKKPNMIGGIWTKFGSQGFQILEQQKDVLHDPEYASQIGNAHQCFETFALCNMKNGNFKYYNWSDDPEVGEFSRNK